MRSHTFIITSVITLGLSACASQTPDPAPAQKSVAPATAAPSPAPQCWNGDAGKFEAVGAKATISGVAVSCEKTTDGKNAQWMGKKH